VFTTIITEPILRLVYSDKVLARDIAEAERAALGVPDAYRVLAVVDEPGRGEHLLDSALDLLGGESPSEVVLTTFRPFPRAGLEVGSGLVGELDEMAASLATSNELARRAEARGASCVVLSRFSDDPGRDVLSQADGVAADVILLDRPAAGDPDGVAAAVLAGASQAVVLRDGPAPGGEGPVVVRLDDAATDAAVAVAVRVARGRGTGVRLVADAGGRRSGRHAAALVERLRKAGVDAAVEDAAATNGAAAVVVRGAGPAAPAGRAADRPTLYVRAADGDERGDLERLLERLATDDRAPAPAGRGDAP
jgi:mRNA-degrading endonuclease toxin of MazEF toxin-antitoxin module